MITLFYNCWNNPTGAATFTEHLYNMLTGLGEEVRLCAIKKTASKPKPIHKFGGVLVENITIEEALQLAHETPSLMAHFMRGGEEEELCLRVVEEAACPFVIHDPRGARKNFVNAARINGAKVVLIRESMQQLFKSKFPDVKNNIFLRHPYIPQVSGKPYSRKHNAVAISRIAHEKNTQIIAEANTILPANERIDIFGSISDRIYAHFILDQKFPEWRNNYFKEPQAHGVDTFSLCQHSNFAIDMSTFKGEGGGSQYCFLEAMEANCCLVLHKDWTRYSGEMKSGYNCLTAADAQELAEIVRRPPVSLPGYTATLAQHSVKEVSQEWLDLFR